MSRAILSSALALLLTLPSATLDAQSADELIQMALERHEQRIAEVEDFTLIQEMNGMPMPPLYYEKEQRDGHPVFVSPSPAQLALRGTGMNLTQLRDLLLGSFAQAGLQSVVGALEGVTGEDLAGMVGVLGDELLSGALPAGAGGGMPGAAPPGPAPGARPGSGEGEVTGELARAVLQGVREDDFKGALIGAAKRVGLDAATNALEAATGVQIGAVVNALREADNFGDAMGNLAKALPSLAGGILSRAAGIPGLPGPGGGGQPGPLGGPPGAPGMAGPVMDPQAMMSSSMLTGAASAGASMALNAGMRAITGLLPGGGGQIREDEFAVLRQLQGRARLEGSKVVDGQECWVLVADDVADLDLGEFSPTSLTLYLDKAELVPRGGSMEGEMKVQGERRLVTAQLAIDDYRQVEGMLHAFRTTVSFEGMGPLVSEADRKKMRKEMERARKEMEKARKQREQMEKQLAQLPPEQRRMMEQQLEQLPAMQEQAFRQMEALAEGVQEMSIVVTELRVNEGPPPELLSPAGPPGMPIMMPGMGMPGSQPPP